MPNEQLTSLSELPFPSHWADTNTNTNTTTRMHRKACLTSSFDLLFFMPKTTIHGHCGFENDRYQLLNKIIFHEEINRLKNHKHSIKII